MSTRLFEIISATVGAGLTVYEPHTLNVNGVATKPDLMMASRSGLTINATATQVEITNNTAGTIQADIWLEIEHSLVRQLGGGINNLTPRPFVAAPSAYDETIGKLALLANIAAAGTINGTPVNVQNVAHIGASGVYTITLTTPVPNVDNAIVTFGVAGGAGPIAGLAWAWTNPSTLVVTARDPATNAVLDSGFTVAVQRSL
jgi:hypothetical protein